MANPQKVANIHGTLVLASSNSTNSGEVGLVELNLPIGTVITNGATATTANVTLKAIKQSVFALVRLSSGTANVVLDTTSNGTTPTFLSANKVAVQVTHGEPVYVGPMTTSFSTVTNTNGVITANTVTNIVAVAINNLAGASLTLQELRLLTLVTLGTANCAFDSRTSDLYSASNGLPNDGSGSFVTNT